MKFEINELRETTKLMAPFADFDLERTFYYDETNNIGKFYVKETDFNTAFDSNFILGGIVSNGNIPDFTDFIKGLNLQPNVNEIKFKHIANGDFTYCIKSRKLKSFLELILNSKLSVHYSSLNILYFSIVDIVDSAIANSEISLKLGQPFAMRLKNDLYKLSRLEKDSIVDLFYYYQYPNIKKEKVANFISDLTNLFQEYENSAEFHFGLTSLKQILRESEKSGSLPFIMDETDYILLKDFSHFYLRPLYVFRNSEHIFDNEDTIKATLENYELTENGTIFKHYEFKDSKEDILIQLSDVFVGIVGKFFNFINTSTIEQIDDTLKTFSEIQKENLCLYLNLITKANNENIGFIHNTMSISEMEKLSFVFKKGEKYCS
tara:strand:- start:9419 stop:10549 length:1131 start_codon:yes stop_codon:yes gene_type:complete